MNSAYVFRAEVCSNSDTLETVVIFTSAHVPSFVIDTALTESLRSERINPDLVLLLTPEPDAHALINTLREPLLSERFNRLRRARGVLVCAFNSQGKVANTTWIRESSRHGLDITAIVISARDAGLKSLARREGVVTLAPPGAYFRNPSQAPRSYFIRAGLMCRDSVETSFIAFALLPIVHTATCLYEHPPNIVWVDTVGIAHIAYALANLGERLGAFASVPEVRSFSSYGGYKEISPGTDERPIVLISASTSGALARDVVQTNKGISAKVVTTILGSFDGTYPELVCTLASDQRGAALLSTDTLREIRVAGEDFLFRPGEPNAVELKRAQLPQEFRKYFQKLQGKRLVYCFKRVSADRRPKPLILDASSLVEDKDFQEWVISKSIGSLPLSVKRIVYQQDEPSRRMAELVRDTLKPYRGDQTPEISSVEEIERLPADVTSTVAVVAAVAGSGMELMRATKALRTYQPHGSRYFIVGVLFARTYAQLTQLQSNLRMSDDRVTYGVTRWCEFAASPDALVQFRQRELEWLKQCAVNESTNATAEALEQFARNRLITIGAEGIIRAGQKSGQDQFVSLSGTESAFDLSDGFALWYPKYKHRCLGDVLFTVACWLQNGRENKSLKPEERLDEGGFQQSVIAPDCFLRFTDPVIQSALLRAARDSELDYRSSIPLSARASEILRKFFSLKEEASVEFIMALAFGRMRLRDDDLNRVADTAITQLPNDARVIDLVNRIRIKYLGLAERSRWSPPTAPSLEMLSMMLQLQDEMNQKINPQWLSAGYPYLRAIFVEAVEALDHHGWKWWKQKTSDIEQVRIELIDIWHFVLSDYLISARGDIAAAAIQMSQDWLGKPAIEVDGRTYDASALDVPELLELLGTLSALRRRGMPVLIALFSACSLTASTLFRSYVGKNVLNHFRQDHGYADGTYKKTWDGKEDNVHLAEIMDCTTCADEALVAQVSAQLRLRYESYSKDGKLS